MFIDSHCHLDVEALDEQRDGLMKRCADVGIAGFLVPATTYKSWSKIASLAEHYPQWRVAYGLHPYFLNQAERSHIELLGEQSDASNALAVGEIGLDCWPGAIDLTLQMDFFRRQLSVSKSLHLPVILHTRKSEDLVLKCLRDIGVKEGGVVHAFNGSLEQAKRFVDLGFVLGIGGTVTYSRAKKAHRVLASLSSHSFVLETDSPDMPLSGFQGQVNTPLSIPMIAQHVASIRGESVEQIKMQTYNNLLSVFPRWNEDLF
ncbi:TatD family hydrolase [Marinomonas sp. IMCC 4694]|uniref:TatD family hydrolase n=1 Tax=Marinomonas sp. IMCC 4694 TaxID=2605432 RepID=UPI0011E81027|nr:TatD family hydrolase [Marinomonas sp. IMCC 4694]TYL47191.1 TatD family deoxyribonuclease [Marinomonas sp. IMCC 4694]